MVKRQFEQSLGVKLAPIVDKGQKDKKSGVSLTPIRKVLPEQNFPEPQRLIKKDREKMSRTLQQIEMSGIEVVMHVNGDLKGCQEQSKNNKGQSHLEHVKVDILRRCKQILHQHYEAKNFVRAKFLPLVTSISIELAATDDPTERARGKEMQDHIHTLEIIYEGCPSPSREQEEMDLVEVGTVASESTRSETPSSASSS